MIHGITSKFVLLFMLMNLCRI